MTRITALSLLTLFAATACAADKPLSIPLTLHSRGGAAGLDWPITFGVPFPEGVLEQDQLNHLQLIGPDGQPLPIQTRTTATWLDSSVQWVLVDAQTPLPAEAESYELSVTGKTTEPTGSSQVTCEEQDDRLVINTGVLEFAVSKEQLTPFLFMRVRQDDGTWVDAFPGGEHAELYLEDGEGHAYRGSLANDPEVVVEESGPQRVAIKIEGWMTSDDGDNLGRRVVRIYAFAGMKSLRVFDTWVNTADTDKVKFANISLHLPFVGDRYHFLDAGMQSPASVKDDAYLLQHEHDAYEVIAEGKHAAQGERASGRVTVSDGPTAYSTAWRHFWQMYPNEIEVQPGTLMLHFWPRHGKKAVYRHEPSLVNIKNLPQLRWVHEGETLDFAAPEGVEKFDYPDYPRDYSHNILNNVSQTNAFGIARTSEYWLDFHGEGAQTDTIARLDTFEAHPIMLAGPQWMADSEAFWEMEPWSETYAELEKPTAKMLDFYVTMYDYLGDYGKWLFGGYHQDYHPTLEFAWVHRTWPGLHHGMPRWPWLTLVRSGDPHYFTFAEILSRHLTDIWIVQWEDPAFNASQWKKPSAPYRYPGKYRGGVTVYKGLVPWYQGAEVSYNAQVDFALWYYYLTGYQHAYDVALMQGELLLRQESLLRQEKGMPDAGQFPPDDFFPTPALREAYFKDFKGSMHNLLTPGRQGTGPGATALQLYRATHDKRYLAIAKRVLDHDRAAEDESPGDGYSNLFYAPILARYWQVTHDESIKPYIVKWAHDRMTIDGRQWDGRDQYYDLMALGYEFTKDPVFLEHGIAQTQVVRDNRFADNMGDDLAGTAYWVGSPSGVGYTGQQWGYFQSKLDEYYETTGQRLTLPGPLETYPFTSLISSTKQDSRYRLNLILRKQSGEAIDLKLRFNSKGDDPITWVLYNPRGDKLATREVQPRPVEGRAHPNSDEGAIEIPLPAGAQAGDYHIRLTSRSRIDLLWPAPEGYSKLIVETPVDMSPRMGPPLRVIVPTESTLRMSLPKYRDRDYSTHRLYNADGEEVFAFTAAGETNTPAQFDVPVPPDQRGRPWYYRRSSSQSEAADLQFEGVLPYMGFAKETFFLPEQR